MTTLAETRPRPSTFFQWLRAIGATVGALGIGVLGLSLLFSDLGPGESTAGRVVFSVLTFALGGCFVGLIAGKRCWYLSALCSWGGVLIGLATARLGLDRFLVFLVLPLLLSLGGGYASLLSMRAWANRKPRQHG